MATAATGGDRPQTQIQPCSYKVGKTLGAGSYSVVKECIHIDTGRYYAAKMINKKLMAGKEHMIRNGIAMFKKISVSHHQNILTLVDMFETMNNVYLVTDIALGGELFERICRKGSYHESDAANLIRTTLSAITYIHDHGIVHGNLKPQNLLFRTPEDNADLLVDIFGLSRIIDEEQFHVPTTASDTTGGTRGYIAPEMFQHTSHDKPVDLWALGVITYFLLCGYPPFDRDSDFEEMLAIINADYSFTPHEYWRGVSDSAKDFIRCCLTIDPAERITAHEALQHPFVAGWARSAGAGADDKGADLLPTVKTNFNARGMLHVVTINTVKAISKVRREQRIDGNKSREPGKNDSDNNQQQTPSGGRHLEVVEAGRLSDTSSTKFKTNTPTQYNSALKLVDTELLSDLKLEQIHHSGPCWTCSPMDLLSTDLVPITIDNVPVVIPVETRYPLRAPLNPPPDPHPKFIVPSDHLPDETIHEIFNVYDRALGFYLLMNGQLQIIVPDDFDFDQALSHRPREFGGLNVSYILESVVPTAALPSQADVQQTTSTNLAPQTLPSSDPQSTAIHAPSLSQGAPLKMVIGSTIQAFVGAHKAKERFEGRVGVMTKSLDKSFLTIPTHVITSALTAAKTSSFPGDSWIGDVMISSSNGGQQLGPVAETFDPDANQFPLGFLHDISLVDVTGAPTDLVSGIKAPIQTEWLSITGWQEMKYHTTKLYVLNHLSGLTPRQPQVKSIGLLESQCQAVGQGIFRMREPPPRPSRFLRRSSSKQPADPRLDDPGTWTSLVARSLLLRIHPEFRPPGSQSGTAVCTVEVSQDGTPCAKVAGFIAFAQEVSVVQNFDLDGPRLYSRLEQGRVAFYGAFQVPEKLKNEHVIVC